jgi:hypothetical protein
VGARTGLASELVGWGGLERADGSGYRVRLRLWEVGSLAPRGETVRVVTPAVRTAAVSASRQLREKALPADTSELG